MHVIYICNISTHSLITVIQYPFSSVRLTTKKNQLMDTYLIKGVNNGGGNGSSFQTTCQDYLVTHLKAGTSPIKRRTDTHSISFQKLHKIRTNVG